MSNSSLTIKLHPRQFEVANDPHRFRVLVCGRRFGKSVLARMIILKWAMESPGLYWIVSPTYKTSKMIHWRDYQHEIPRHLIKRKNEVELSFELINGSRIELKGAENPDSLRGVKLKGLVVDECASIRNWEWLWDEVLRPTLTDYEAPAVFCGTPKGYNSFYDLFIEGQKVESNYKSWRFTSYDNPYIPKSEIDAAKAELTEDTFAQEYLADFRRFTGLVYKDFDRSINVKELPDFQPVFWLRGLDRGFRNPSALAVIAVDKDGVWYQTNELYEAGLTNPQLMDKVNDVCKGKTFELSSMDSASASDIQDLNNMGMDWFGVKKEPGDSGISYVRYKVQKLSERLRVKADGRAGYYVDPRCENTIKEFEVYRWPEKKNETDAEPENPEKINDHMMDAIADLNASYLHFYEVKIKKPWEGKLPGTFIPPAIIESEQNDFDSDTKIDTYWES